MKKKILELTIIAVLIVSLFLPIVYAAGANISLSKSQVKPGDTVELYFDLTTNAVEYDVVVEPKDKSLIGSSELESEISKGNAQSFSLYQDGNGEKTTYKSGTRIATIKYTIKDSAKAGDKIVLSIAGDVLDEKGLRSKFDEEVTINIVNAPSNPPTNTPTNTPVNTVQPENKVTENKVPENKVQPENKTQPENTQKEPANVPVTNIVPREPSKPSEPSNPIPKAGMSSNSILVAICALCWMSFISYVNIRKIDKKSVRTIRIEKD